MRISLVDPIPHSLREIPGGTVAARCDDGVLVFDQARRAFRVDHDGVAALDRDEVNSRVAEAFREAGERIWSADYPTNVSESLGVGRRRILTDRILRIGLTPAILQAVGEIARRPDARAFGVVFEAAGRMIHALGRMSSEERGTPDEVAPIFDEAIDTFCSQMKRNDGTDGENRARVAPLVGEPVEWVSLLRPYRADDALAAGLEPVGACDGGVLAYDRDRHPYRVDARGATALVAESVNRAVADAVDEAGPLIWPRGHLRALSLVTGIARRSLRPQLLAEQGLPPKVIRFVGEMARHPDAGPLGEAIVAVAKVHDGTCAGPEAVWALVDEALNMHERWLASRPNAPYPNPEDGRPDAEDAATDETEEDLAPRM